MVAVAIVASLSSFVVAYFERQSIATGIKESFTQVSSISKAALLYQADYDDAFPHTSQMVRAGQIDHTILAARNDRLSEGFANYYRRTINVQYVEHFPFLAQDYRDSVLNRSDVIGNDILPKLVNNQRVGVFVISHLFNANRDCGQQFSKMEGPYWRAMPDGSVQRKVLKL
jgi:hypothetical protein